MEANMTCDIIGDFFSTIKTFFTLTAIAIIIIVIIVAIKAIKDRAEKRERHRQEEEKKKEREIQRRENELRGERRKNNYWNNLCLVYGDKDHETLSDVLYWLEEFNRLPDILDDGYNSYVSQERQECREKIKALLNYPEWIVESDDKSNAPIWLDLDITYVKLLLQ